MTSRPISTARSSRSDRPKSAYFCRNRGHAAAWGPSGRRPGHRQNTTPSGQNYLVVRAIGPYNPPDLALAPGTRLGVYDITAQIGAGGMGEVYRATDTNLKRQVAIKVLPAAVAGDADRLARFQHEAEVLAALNHPNIAAIYGPERTPDFTALRMAAHFIAAQLFNGEGRVALPGGKACFQNTPPVVVDVSDDERLRAVNARVSPDLGIVTVSRRSDEIASVDYEVTNIRRDEPPANLFEVPTDYRLVRGSHDDRWWGSSRGSRLLPVSRSDRRDLDVPGSRGRALHSTNRPQRVAPAAF
jgi:hypothetical protein